MVFHSLECSFVDSTVHSVLYTGSASDQGSTGQAASQCEGVGGRRVGRGDPAALPEHSGTHNSEEMKSFRDQMGTVISMSLEGREWSISIVEQEEV